MSLVYITEDAFERLSEFDYRVCVFCDNSTTLYACPDCGEYKGIMSVEEWEEYTGEVWVY